ncbi:MAG TPA: cobyric acid synthase [Solirubrobacteraceae bacterium]|nr:cobyric acid synthase [Solirubrobacteraceae bacterium]
MSGALLVAGTASDAGKSLVGAGLCRWLARRGVRVAPFKAQNMALNSCVTRAGAEIGRAQVMQAAAAGAEPEAAMNPVLIKPSGAGRSQVMLMGHPHAEADARGYQRLRDDLREPVLGALADLRARFDVVVCEGAGSPAEVNLRAGDLANMGLARAAGLPVIVVGDIDRGGVFAALYGTLALLEPADQALVAGFVINRFRGDRAILEPGLAQLRELTARPVLGVLPHLEGLWLDAEDSLALERPARPVTAPLGSDILEVAVVRLRWTSNFTDVDALGAEPGVHVRFTRSAADVERADLVVVPGTKATVEDLEGLRADGLADALVRRARAGAPLLGLCGGYQMLGEAIVDEVESGRGAVDGLGLLSVRTIFATGKLLRQVAGTAPALGGVPAQGYEIRHGRVERRGGEALLAPAGEDQFAGLPGEGCVQGAVMGTSWHGVLEGDELRRALLGWVARARGRDWRAGDEPFAAVRERHLDRLGDLIEEHADTEALRALLDDGAPGGLPTLPAAGVAA